MLNPPDVGSRTGHIRGAHPEPPTGFDLTEPIGHGASSVVWRAIQVSTGRAVALKILDADVSDPNAERRFERERAAMAQLAIHPGIVTIYDAGVQDGTPWLAMELCRRGSLATYVTTAGTLDVGTALAVLTKLATALDAAHDLGIVHCDIKPANVMLLDSGEPALGDFGIARVSVGRATTTTVGGFSLDHVAPELLEDEKSSTRSDVYSLGTTIWELLAGHPPYRRHGDVSVGRVIKRIMTEPLPELPDVPADVTELLASMTRKDPDDRIPTMSEVLRRAHILIERYGDGTGLGAAPIESDPPVNPSLPPVINSDDDETLLRKRKRRAAETPLPAPPTGRGRRARVVAALAALLALALATAAAIALWPRTVPTQPIQIGPVAEAATQAPIAPTSAPDLVAPTTTDSSRLAGTGADVAVPAAPVPTVPRAVITPEPVRPSPEDPQPVPAPATVAPRPAPAPAVAPSRPDGSACFATAISGGLVLGSNRQHIAGGPNFTSSACNAIHIKLTSALYRTYARSCLETSSGSTITTCSGWILLSYPNTWDTLSTAVPGGSRWQIQMYSEGPERVAFYYTA